MPSSTSSAKRSRTRQPRGITQEWVTSKYEETLASQQQMFSADTTSLETALDSVSDSSFVLYSPDENYGFVLNILLPFSATQTAALNAAPADRGDVNGNKFMTRASPARERSRHRSAPHLVHGTRRLFLRRRRGR